MRVLAHSGLKLRLGSIGDGRFPIQLGFVCVPVEELP